MATDPGFVAYYLNELHHLRREGDAFARSYPDLAHGLGFDQDGMTDPQVGRLVESFAFLTAKLQRQFDAQFPEIPTALLEALYPQLAAPIPSMAVAHVAVSAAQQRAVEGIVIPRETTLHATTTTGAECRFRTGAALRLWPIVVTAAELVSSDVLGIVDDRQGAEACLRLTLSCLGTRTFADLAPPALRFHLDGDVATRFRLFEMLVTGTVRAGIRAGPDAALVMHPLTLRHVGLDPEDALLPWPTAGHQGYRLLQEYFAFPDKFLFVEIAGFAPGMLGEAGEAELALFLDQEPVDGMAIDARAMRLNCVPVVNLFERTSEPIRLDHMQVDYTLEPDVRAAGSTEIHSILSVGRAADPSPADIVQPYFSASPDTPGDQSLRWLARRRRIGNVALSGTEIQLSFVDPRLDPVAPAGVPEVLFARMLCTNRALGRQVAVTTDFTLEMDVPVGRIRCLARPTPPIDPPLAGENLWRLVSHLRLNALSLTAPTTDDQTRSALTALKEILFLYGGGENSRARRQIEGLTRLTTRTVVRRIGSRAWRGFVGGTEVVLAVDPEHFAGSSALLFGAVLDRFLALYAGVNSFTELVVRRAREEEEWKRWPARVGDKPVL